MSKNIDEALNEISQYMYEKSFNELPPYKQWYVRSQARREGKL